ERWQVALFDLVSEELSKLLDARLSAKRYLLPTQASVSHTLHQVPPSVVLRFVAVVHGSPGGRLGGPLLRMVRWRTIDFFRTGRSKVSRLRSSSRGDSDSSFTSTTRQCSCASESSPESPRAIRLAAASGAEATSCSQSRRHLQPARSSAC